VIEYAESRFRINLDLAVQFLRYLPLIPIGQPTFPSCILTFWDLGGCGSAFSAIIVSPKFEKKTSLARNRLVNTALKEEIKSIHAWSPKCYTPEQWAKLKEEGKETPKAPGKDTNGEVVTGFKDWDLNAGRREKKWLELGGSSMPFRKGRAKFGGEPIGYGRTDDASEDGIWS
jgi:stress-induced morphogen